MFATKVSRVLINKDWTVLHRLNQVKKFALRTARKNDNYVTVCKRHSTNLCALNEFKNLSVTPNLYQTESLYARNILEKSDRHSNSLVYSTTIEKDSSNDNIECATNKQWNSMSNAEILDNFEILSCYASKQNSHIDDPEYQRIFEVFESRITTFSDEELFNLLNCLNLWNKTRDRLRYKGFWKVLDEECSKRLPSWDLQKILLVNDYFYNLRLLKISRFTYASLQKLDPNDMSPTDLLHYAFLLKVNERLPVNLERFEFCLEKYANEFKIEELGIIAMMFFKYETRIRSKQFVVLLINKLILNIDNVGDIALSAILKTLRYSVFLEIGQHFLLLLDALMTQVSKRNLMTLTQFAHIQASTLMHNKELTSQILDRFEKEIKSARIKDIERILFTLYIFAYDPKTTPFYTLAKDEFLDPARKNEIETYPHVFIYSVLFMLQMNFYPEEALKIIMDPAYIDKFTKGNLDVLNREYLFLDYSIEIEYPQYNGPRLKTYIRNCLVKKYGPGSEDTRGNQRTKLMVDVANTCKAITNSNSAVYVGPLLPHFVTKNVVLCYDENQKKFLNPIKPLYHFNYDKVKYAPNDGKKWYALVMGTHNLLTRNTFEPTGLLTVHMRHLKRIGYIPILIPYADWLHRRTDLRKREYLKFLLNQ